MKYQYTELTEEIIIKKIISIHYFEYMSDFCFPGESHDFWEFLYVDKGEVDVMADKERITLKKNEMIFHQPNEFHSVMANGQTAPNLVVIGLVCQSPCMEHFKERIVSVGREGQEILAHIIAEARQGFEGRLDDPGQEKLVRRKQGGFGAEQMIKIYLEQLLIHIVRHIFPLKEAAGKNTAPLKTTDQNIDRYLEEHIGSRLTIEQISRDNFIGTSQLKKMFRERAGCGVITYFNRMKIDMAKQLIRNNELNFTQIAGYLGYDSVHYFSRQFKQLTGMSPSEYADSVKKIADYLYF